MKKFIILLAITAAMWQVAFSQFETLWYKQLPSGITTVNFSHDSKLIMAWLSPNIMIFDAASGDLVNDKIPATAQYPFFSKDDTHIYGRNINKIFYYNLQTGIDESQFDSTDMPITHYAVSKNEKYLVATVWGPDYWTYGLRIWDIKTGKIIKSKTLIAKDTTNSQSPYDWRLYSASYDNLNINCDNSKIYLTTIFVYYQLDNKGNMILSQGGETKILDFISLDSIDEIPNVSSYFFISDYCTYFAVFGRDSNGANYYIYDNNSKKLISTIKTGGGMAYIGAKFASEDQYLITASGEGGGLAIWDVKSGGLILRQYPSGFQSLDVSSYFNYIGTSAADYLGVYKIPVLSVPEKPEVIETIYPNPTTGDISLRFLLPKSSTITGTLTGVDGSNFGKIFNNMLNEGVNTLNFSLSKYPAGIYFITLNALDFKKEFKIIIMR